MRGVTLKEEKGMEYEEENASRTQEQLKQELVKDIRGYFGELSSEIADRNAKISDLDGYIYGTKIKDMLDIPVGHDSTPVNWLKRTVEVHKNVFMSRGFQVISTYDSQNERDAASEEDRGRIRLANGKRKLYAEIRKNIIDTIIRDNDGGSLWLGLAENASSVGTSVVKAYYDEDEEKYIISQVEAVENFYALWSQDDFRKAEAYMFLYQVSKSRAIREFGASEDVTTSPVGKPLEVIADSATSGQDTSTQPMVTIMEVTGKICGWASKNGNIEEVAEGKETPMNLRIVGNEIKRIIDRPKFMPKYYILPNKRERRRPWGASDVSDAAIDINLTYVETLSDWRTHASKVNFQKYKAFGFGFDQQLPKSEPRKVQTIPLSEGQDLVPLNQGDSNGQDFKMQMEELKEQFVRETGISRVLFDDPSVTLNSNQALITSMKPTSDISEAKKQIWSPVIIQIFKDALDTLAEFRQDLKEVVASNDNWSLKVMWPSMMQKEDPIFQQMLLNRFNAKTMSLQSYLEAQGETQEEIDRIRDDMQDPVTAAIIGNQMPLLAQQTISPVDPNAKPEPQIRHNVSWQAQMTPQQEANLAQQVGFQDGPFGQSMGPQGQDGYIAQSNVDNQGFLNGNPRQGGTPIERDQNGNQIPTRAQKTQEQPNGQPPAQVNTQANNTEGSGAVSQPGSGATATSPQGALDQNNQQQGG